VGADLAPDERERLRRVHELLLAAGRPPELPPALQLVHAEEPVRLLPRRRRAALLALAAALALAVFGAGYIVGDRGEKAQPGRVVAMAGLGDAAGARASLAIFDADDAGNWPMELTIRGLQPLPAGQTYELWLVRDGKLVQQCGVFAVKGDETVVPLNAPFKLKEYDGWIVVRRGETEPLLTT